MTYCQRLPSSKGVVYKLEGKPVCMRLFRFTTMTHR